MFLSPFLLVVGKGLPQKEYSVSSTHQKEDHWKVGPLPARGQDEAVAGRDVVRGTEGRLGVCRCPGVRCSRDRTGSQLKGGHSE